MSELVGRLSIQMKFINNGLNAMTDKSLLPSPTRAYLRNVVVTYPPPTHQNCENVIFGKSWKVKVTQ